MSATGTERRLSAVMFTDIVGYPALLAQSEERALEAQARQRRVVQPLVKVYHGTAIGARGDQSLALFPTALDAVSCALAILDALHGEELRLQIGIHVGDLVTWPGGVRGDGVDVATRISAVVPGGGLRVSSGVYHSLREHQNIAAVPLGEHYIRNVGREVGVYALGRPGSVLDVPARRRRPSHRARYALATALLVTLAALGWWSLR